MILVADSGSSKTDWLLAVPDAAPLQFRSKGLNPYFLNEKQIAKVLQDQLADLIAHNDEIDEIYFFGAGCSSPDRHEIVSNALSQHFTKAFISVDSDLLGCAYATCGHHKGLCCVLGTGSNISYFDGEEIHAGKHGLGFVLGDEGSGTWFGKRLITDFLYDKMPADIHQLFKKEYDLKVDDVMNHVYQQPNANTYLASFTKFLGTIRETGYAKEMINAGLSEFIGTNIRSYPEYHNYKCHFVGSIADAFSEELKALCKAQGISVGKIMKHPINDLMEFILGRGR